MHDVSPYVNENLVRNGDFYLGFQDWTRRGKVEKEAEDYLGKTQTFMAAYNEGTAWQEVTLPKSSSDNVYYILSFLWETRHTQSGWLYVYKNAVQVQKIELKPGYVTDSQNDPLRGNAVQPLELIPNLYRERLESSFEADDILRIEIQSPKNDSGLRQKVCVTCIELLVELDSPNVQTLIFDGEQRTAGDKLYLCLGSELLGGHRLQFCLPDKSPWLGTQAALMIDINPMEAITAVPDLGVNQSVVEQWFIRCPILDNTQDYDFTLSLLNQYTAAPYEMQVSLGHHRLEMTEPQEAAYSPVHGETVRLGVRVVSFYNGQSVDGRTVSWSVAGSVIDEVSTDEQGWAHFDYSPTAEQVGDIVVAASVKSPYYVEGVSTHDFSVEVLAADPWPHLMIFEEGEITQWATDGYPNRGSAHTIDVSLPDDSPLRDGQFSMRWMGDTPVELGVVVDPALGEWQQATGSMRWTFTCEDRIDGQFELFLVSSKLLKPSPIKRMFLARNKVDIGEVREANKSPVVDENESVLLRLRVLHATDSDVKTGVTGALVDWELPGGAIVHTKSGDDGWAGASYMPVEAGESTVNVSVKAHPKAKPIPWSFKVNAIATSPWKNEVKTLLDDVEVERNILGLLCRRGQQHVLELLPQSNQWLGRNISLHWRGDDPELGMKISNLDEPRPLTAAGLKWTLDASASDVSSLFELKLSIDGNEPDRELTGRLFSQGLSQEMSLMFDQMRAALDDQPLYPCLCAKHDFKVLPAPLSPLVGLNVTLAWSGTSPEELQATVLPELGAPQTLTDGGFTWALNFSRSLQAGQFQLTVELPQLALSATAKAMQLAHNKVRIEQWQETKVTPVVDEDPLCLWAQVVSAYSGLGAGQVPVKWQGIAELVEPTGDDGWSGFAHAPVAAGEQAITASIDSPYNGYPESRSMTISALASSPWAGLTLSIDGNRPEPFGKKTFFARRKSTHRIEINAEGTSELFDRHLKLGMVGKGPSKFGIRFTEPVLGVPKLFSDSGLVYEFTVGDDDNGSFGFCVAADQLANLSPINAVSVGEGSQVVKIVEHSRVSQTLLWGETLLEQITVVSIVNGKAMRDVPVKWRHPDLGEQITTTNFFGVATITFVPKTPGAGQLTATVGDERYSESITLPYTLNEPREILDLWEPSDSEDYAHAKVVSALTGLPLTGVEVAWEYENQPLGTSLTGEDGIARLTSIFTAHGILYATVKGGIAGWQVKSLLLGGAMPIIADLQCDRTTTYPGYQINAWATVKESPKGEPAKEVEVDWQYAEQPLPSSTSDGDGVARITFMVPVVGKFELVASLSSATGSRTQQITVAELPTVLLRSIFALPAIVQAGNTTTIKLQVVKNLSTPVLGIAVAWAADGQPVDTTYSNEEGWSQMIFQATTAGTVVIEATVKNPVGVAKTSLSLPVI